MIDGTYNIKVDTPFGRKDGTIALRTDGEALLADVDAPIVGKTHIEGHAEGDKFTARGSGKIKLAGKIDYTLEGEVAGNELFIHINSNKGEFDLRGVRI